jgi:hypothetical protein
MLTLSTSLKTLRKLRPATFLRSSKDQAPLANRLANKAGYFDTSSNPDGVLKLLNKKCCQPVAKSQICKITAKIFASIINRHIFVMLHTSNYCITVYVKLERLKFGPCNTRYFPAQHVGKTIKFIFHQPHFFL